jgi:formate-dependent nitrite reductase membrane component NrfD
MNLYVADPDWRWWIVSYFFLGGIAAGAYFTATLIDLATGERGRRLSRVGYLLAFPLVLVCAVLLTLDLGRPERFWHMIFKSEVAKEALQEGWPTTSPGWSKMAQAPILKPWSPMSAGSLGLAVFGVCSALSLAGSLRPDGKLLGWLERGPLARLLQFVGCLAGFFLAAYTGSLLSATNEPLWSDTTWIAPLFLISAASTGIAALLLLGGGRAGEEMHEQLERADVWVIVLEIAVFAAFVFSIKDWLGTIWATGSGKLLLVATPALAMALPLLLYLLRSDGPRSMARSLVALAAVAALGGGFLLRYSLLHTPPELLARGPALLAHTAPQPLGTPERFPEGAFFRSPEDGRAAGEPGADPMNRPVTPRTKIPEPKAGE